MSMYTSYYEKQIIKLAKYLQENYPEAVERNKQNEDGGSAVSCVIEILEDIKQKGGDDNGNCKEEQSKA